MALSVSLNRTETVEKEESLETSVEKVEVPYGSSQKSTIEVSPDELKIINSENFDPVAVDAGRMLMQVLRQRALQAFGQLLLAAAVALEQLGAADIGQRMDPRIMVVQRAGQFQCQAAPGHDS